MSPVKMADSSAMWSVKAGRKWASEKCSVVRWRFRWMWSKQVCPSESTNGLISMNFPQIFRYCSGCVLQLNTFSESAQRSRRVNFNWIFKKLSRLFILVKYLNRERPPLLPLTRGENLHFILPADVNLRNLLNVIITNSNEVRSNWKLKTSS